MRIDYNKMQSQVPQPSIDKAELIKHQQVD